MDKTLIGNTKEGKYPNQVDIGFRKEDIDKLASHLNEKGWVNLRVSKSKAGNFYTEIVLPK